MEDSTLFMQWAMDTLQHQQPASAVDDCGETTFPSLQSLRHASHAAVLVPELMTEAHAANSWSTGDTTDGSGGGNFSAPAAMEHDVWPPSPNSSRCAPGSSSSGTDLPVTSWNFSAASTQPVTDGMLEATAVAPRPYDSGVPELVYGSAPTRRSAVRSTGPMSSAPHAQDHIIAERKRREKINKRFIELSTVIPGLKKMDKATILSDAASYVKELQEKLKALEAAGSNGRSIGIETVVLVKKPYLAARRERLPVVGVFRMAGGEELSAGDRGAVLGEQPDDEDPLRERQGGGCEGACRGRRAPPLHHSHQCHAVPGVHRDHNHHGKGGGGLHCHSRGDRRKAQLCTTTA